MSDERKAGRPPGSIETPKKLLSQDMIATSKLNREMRGLTEKLLKDIQTAAAGNNLSLEDKLKIITVMTASLHNQNRSLESLSKVLAAAEAQAGGLDGSDEQSPEDILAELSKGRKNS